MTSILRSKLMKTLGIRLAKARLSELVRDAAKGECSIVTDNRKPVAMIGPPPQDHLDVEHSPPPAKETRRLSNAVEFLDALFRVPFPIEFRF
jgi:antitoxin (DNA-binding transcriptional repressor) of toxin-antitoxin stability system